MTPKRIQRRRTKGFKLPPNTVCVTRPGKWGNPYPIGNEVDMPDGSCELIMSAERSIEFYQFWLLQQIVDGKLNLAELRGKNLACYCPLTYEDGSHRPCHADVLLEIANR